MTDFFAPILTEFARFLELYGDPALAVLVWSEAWIEPVPIDPVLAAAAAVSGDPLRFWAIGTVASAVGGATGWALGRWLGHPVAARIFSEKKLEKGEKFFEKWGALAVVFVAIAPIPYKIAAWLAGIFEMKFWPFFLASIIGRGVRFAAVAWGADAIFKFFGLGAALGIAG